MKRERGNGPLIVSSHLTHKLELLTSRNKTSWVDFLEDELFNARGFIPKDDVATQTTEVIEMIISSLESHDEETWKLYISVLYWDEAPWLMLLVHAGDDTDFVMRGLLRTPTSYAQMQEHCAEQKNLLPTLLSATVYQLLRSHPKTHTLLIPEPYDITIRILHEMGKKYAGIIRVDSDGKKRTIVLRDATAFSLIWQKQKHCAEPIAGLCGGCLQVAYCSKECAAENWTFHRHECPRNK
jgi:hypothetical protein